MRSIHLPGELHAVVRFQMHKERYAYNDKVGGEYLGSASSRQKKMAEEQAARDAVQILSASIKLPLFHK